MKNGGYVIGLTYAGNYFNYFIGLQTPNNARQYTQNAALCTARYHAGRGRRGEKIAIIRAPVTVFINMVEYGNLSLENGSHPGCRQVLSQIQYRL